MSIGSYNVNPSTWSSFWLSLRNRGFDDVMRTFLKQLSDFGLQTQNLIGSLQNPVILAGLLNGTSLLNATAFKHVNVTTVNGTTDCTGASIVTCSLVMSVASTMTLNNVADATAFDLRINNSTVGGLLFKIAVNRPGGGAYGANVLSAFTGSETDMTGTGFTVPASSTIYLRGISQLTQGVIALGYV